jgi:hypothetical protein
MSSLLLGDDPKAVSKFIGDVDIITYNDIWNTLENKPLKGIEFFLELLKKIEEFKGGEVELLNIVTKTKTRVSGKVTSINQWENLCIMLATVLNYALYAKPIEDLSPEIQSKLNDLVVNTLTEENQISERGYR